MLKFSKSVPYIPDPARSRPPVSDDDKARAAERPPHAVPFHCKPWLDGQSIGWTLFYGYLTPVVISGREDGRIDVANGEQLAAETGQARIIDQFARGHFGLGSGYSLKSPPGLVSLLIPAAQPPPNLELVTGVVETDWYPRQLFLVYRVPAAGRQIELDHGMPIARVVMVPRHDGLAAEPLTGDELAAYQAEEAAYLAEEATTPTRWQAASGDWFTHLYKLWSQRFRKRQQS